MKLGPVTKLDKGNKKESRRIVCKTYIFIISNFYLTKTESRTKISVTELSHYCFE